MKVKIIKLLINIVTFSILVSISYAYFEDNKYNESLENEISSPTNYIEQSFDVVHYDATLDLTKAPNRDAKGVCEIKVFWRKKSPDNKFFFHLRGLKVDSTFYENVKVTAQLSGLTSSPIYHYEISVPEGIEKDTVIIKIYYSGRMTAEPITIYNPWGGVHSYTDILFSIGVGIRNNYVGTTQHWLPCYDHPSDKATFNFKFIVKAGKKVASNGNVKIHYLDNGTDIYEFSSDFLCATYLMTFAVADFLENNYTLEQVPVELYYLSKDSIYANHSFAKLNQMIQNFQQKFGPYPFEKVGYVVTPIGSMEHQTMISMDASTLKSYYESNDTICTTVAHELSHQWFGNLVTPYDFRDAWLNEAFATFCENLWVETIQGKNAYLDFLSKQIDVYFKNIIDIEGVIPLYNFQKTYTSNNYPWTIYNKGAAVVALLRYHLGDSLFFGFLRYHLQKYAYKNATTEDLIESIKTWTGLDYNWFFDQWIYKSGYPNIKVYYNNQSGSNNPTIRIINTGEYIFKNFPVEITFIYKNGGKSHKVFDITSPDTTFTDHIPDADSIIVNHGETIRTLLKVNEVIITNVTEEKTHFNDFNLSIYPNPAKNYITINLQKPVNRIYYQIIDLLGKVIIIDRLLLENNQLNFKINVSTLNFGIYFIKLEIDGIYYIKPLIINLD